MSKEQAVPEILYPTQVSIETVHGCNARCVFCSVDIWEKPKQPMDTETFEIILKQLAQWGPDHLKQTGLALNGEPLLDPQLAERIKQCKNAKLPNVGFTTHGSLLTAEKAAAILAAAPDYVVFSFDSLDAESYEAHRRNLKHSEVLGNIRNFIEQRNALNSNTRIVIRHIDYDGLNQNFADYRAYFSALLKNDLDEIGYTKLHNSSVRDSIKWREGALKQGCFGTNRCGAPFNRLTIQANGDVVMCPNDFNAEMKIGHVREDTLLNIFNCEKMINIRNVHQAGQRNSLAKCDTCDEPELNASGDAYAKFTPDGKHFFADVFQGFDRDKARKSTEESDLSTER